jgi:hypothetical protein
MRGMWARGDVTSVKDLAAIFNVPKSCVIAVIKRKVYKEVNADYLLEKEGKEGKDAVAGEDVERA